MNLFQILFFSSVKGIYSNYNEVDWDYTTAPYMGVNGIKKFTLKSNYF